MIFVPQKAFLLSNLCAAMRAVDAADTLQRPSAEPGGLIPGWADWTAGYCEGSPSVAKASAAGHSAAHVNRASSAGHKACPQSVSAYSTFGGT